MKTLTAKIVVIRFVEQVYVMNRKIIKSNYLLQIPGCFIVTLVLFATSLCAQEMRSDLDAEMSPVAIFETRHCFPEDDHAREALVQFLKLSNTPGNDVEAQFGTKGLVAEDIKVLQDESDAHVCADFNQMYQHLITMRHVEFPGIFKELIERLDPEAYAYSVGYFKVGRYYFAVLRWRSPQPKDPEERFVAKISGRTLIAVHDHRLNRLGAFDIFGNRHD